MWKKAQITMETILIYGIIALVVLTGIGALIYFGVFDLGNYLPDKCSLNTGDIGCAQWVATATEPMNFGFKNNLNQRVQVFGVTLRQVDGLQVFNPAAETDECEIDCTGSFADPKGSIGCSEAGECVLRDDYRGQKMKFHMTVRYQPHGGAIEQTSSGEMIVKIQ